MIMITTALLRRTLLVTCAIQEEVSEISAPVFTLLLERPSDGCECARSSEFILPSSSIIYDGQLAVTLPCNSHYQQVTNAMDKSVTLLCSVLSKTWELGRYCFQGWHD